MSTYTRWYREGTVSAVAGSNTITGTDTYWETAGLNAGDILKLGGSDYEILAVVDNTHLTISGTYSSDITGSSYAIVRNFTATMPARIASQVSGLLNDFTKYIDTDMQSIHGKSAYELAVASGFSGTQAEWLESLKAAGEWADHDGRISALESESNTWQSKNYIFGRKSLGTEFTADQRAVIKAGTFTGINIGDYWEDKTNNIIWEVYHFNYFWRTPVGATQTFLDLETGNIRYANWGGSQNNMAYMPNHLVLLPRDPVHTGAEPYYTSEQVANGELAYSQSNYVKVIRPAVLEKVVGFFGDEYVLEYPLIVHTAFNSAGYPWNTRAFGRCDLPSVAQVMGYPSPDPFMRGLSMYHVGNRTSCQLAGFAMQIHKRNIHVGKVQLLDVWGDGSGSWNEMRLGFGASMVSASVTMVNTNEAIWRPMIVVGVK